MTRELISTQINIPNCQVSRTWLRIVPDLPYKEWELIGEKLKTIEGAIQFWIGDWIRYGEKTYGEKYEEAEKVTGLENKTLRNATYVADNVEMSRRRDNLSFSHHAEVAPLSPIEQEKWLDKAEQEGLTRRELREEIRASKALPPPPLPDDEFNIIYADPPWRYEFSETESREIENQYPTMELEDIKSLKIPAAEDSVLFLWTTAPKTKEGLEVIEAWGFRYVTNAIWDKQIIGMGYWFRGRHEILMVGVKGKFSPPSEDKRVASVISERRTEHSRKPESFYSLIEGWYPNGKYLELFARNARKNWKSWGNQI